MKDRDSIALISIALIFIVCLSGCLNQPNPLPNATITNNTLPPGSVSGGPLLSSAPSPQNTNETAVAAPQMSLSGQNISSIDQDTAVSIEIKNFAFSPGAITVAPGTTITWTNLDSAPHTVTSTDGRFDSGIFNYGQTFSYTFKNPGTYSYYCTVHPYMKARVVVISSPSSASQPVTSAQESNGSAGSSAIGPPINQEHPVLVEIKKYTFSPDSITVPAGTPVIWRNFDSVPHTVTSTDGRFDSGIFNYSQKFSFTFTDPGTYSYYCAVHPYMKAQVIVTSAQSSISPSQNAATGGDQAESASSPVILTEPGSQVSLAPVSINSPQPSTRVTVDLLAKDMVFDKDKITVIAGSEVFINFVNLDVGVPHNFAVYTGSNATHPLFQGRVITGPAKITYIFNAPVDSGAYFFRCDVHPKVMTGQFYVVSYEDLNPPQAVQINRASRASQSPAETNDMNMPGMGTSATAPNESAQSGSYAASQGVTIDLTAENIAFDKSIITVPAGAKVTVNFNNRDSGVPHNLAVYDTEAARKAIFVGKIITGPDRISYTFTSPKDPGTYFFRCDIHPTMKGQFIVR